MGSEINKSWQTNVGHKTDLRFFTLVDQKNDGVGIRNHNGTQKGTEKEEGLKRNDEFNYGYTNTYVFTKSSGANTEQELKVWDRLSEDQSECVPCRKN